MLAVDCVRLPSENRPPIQPREVAMLLVDRVPVVELCLLGTISFLSCVVWQQRRAIAALLSDRLAIENRLGTIQQRTCVDALTERNRVCAQAVVEHTAPTAIPRDTGSVPEAIPNEVAARTEVTKRTKVTERHAA
jgi:hypothetical protein